jgi:hypothetical protein
MDVWKTISDNGLISSIAAGLRLQNQLKQKSLVKNLKGKFED